MNQREHVTEHKHGGLGQLASTAICGNDITSSCLYVSALAIIVAGRWAPVALLMVAGLLYLFRSIYAEVVGALPLNGGAYNALLNTTSKFRASIAACLTILSYMATAVISASEAIHYLSALWPNGWSHTTIIGVTIGLLAFFMVLTIIGISESAAVAIGIFIIHMASLTLLLVVGIFYVATSGVDTFSANMDVPTAHSNWMVAIFFGFSAALLGISGFESSANFVEEQAEGIFPKTLRNMWIAVGIFNPAMAFLALAIIPIGDLNDANKNALLANMGELAGHGKWLAWIISVDAVLVLSGAVLTSFVGVNGLVHRMSLDRCLPQFLLKTNRRDTTHRIIIAFFLLSVSVLLLTKGDLEALAGVYTLSFLAVMALFCVGNILLKVKRAKLPRPAFAPWPFVIIALVAVVAGLIGNAIMQQSAKLFLLSETGQIEHDAEVLVSGPEGEMTLLLIKNQSFEQVRDVINDRSDQTGIIAKATGKTLTFATEEIGSDARMSMEVVEGHFPIYNMHEPARLYYQSQDSKIAHDAEVVLKGPRGELPLTLKQNDTFGGILGRVNRRKDETGIVAKVADGKLMFVTEEIGAYDDIHAEVVRGVFELHEMRNGAVSASGKDGLSNLRTFLYYFLPTVLIVSMMLGRIALLKMSMFVVRGAISSLLRPMHATTQWIRDKIDKINSQQMVFFTRGDNVANLNNAMLYVKNNEHTNRIRVVTVVKDEDDVPENLSSDIKFLDEVYPDIDIDFEIIKGQFGPPLVAKLSKKWDIPKNFMFIGSPEGHMMYGLAELGGVRLII